MGQTELYILESRDGTRELAATTPTKRVIALKPREVHRKKFGAWQEIIIPRRGGDGHVELYLSARGRSEEGLYEVGITVDERLRHISQHGRREPFNRRYRGGTIVQATLVPTRELSNAVNANYHQGQPYRDQVTRIDTIFAGRKTEIIVERDEKLEELRARYEAAVQKVEDHYKNPLVALQQQRDEQVGALELPPSLEEALGKFF